MLTAASVRIHRSGPLELRGELIKVLHHKTLLQTAAPFPEEVPLGKSGGSLSPNGLHSFSCSLRVFTELMAIPACAPRDLFE